jgi:hypothetical protein
MEIEHNRLVLPGIFVVSGHGGPSGVTIPGAVSAFHRYTAKAGFPPCRTKIPKRGRSSRLPWLLFEMNDRSAAGESIGGAEGVMTLVGGAFVSVFCAVPLLLVCMVFKGCTS